MTAQILLVDCVDRVPDCERVSMRAVWYRWIFVFHFQSVNFAAAVSMFGGIVLLVRLVSLHGAMTVLYLRLRVVIAIAAIHKTLIYS